MRSFNGELLPRPRYPGLREFDFDFWQRKIPTDLEIGSGTGMFALAYAQKNMNRRLIAIEHTRERFEKFSRQFEENKSENLFPVHANAISYIFFEVPDNSTENIYFFYPNPEPKNSNARWFQMPFFSVLIDKLKGGGKVHLVTNLKNYAEEAHASAESVWKLKRSVATEFNQEKLLSARTLFEKKYLERGEICYEQIWIKELES